MADQDTQTTTTTEPTKQPEKQQPAQQPTAEPKFTQDELNAHIGNARKEAKAKVEADLLKELGYESADEMRKAVKAAKEREDAEKTEAQKLQDRIALLEKERDTEKAERAKADVMRVKSAVDSRLLMLAKDMKASVPQDVVDFLRMKHADAVDALMTDDKFDDKAAQKLLDDFKKERGNWFTSTAPGSPSNRDGRPPQPDITKQFGDKPLVRW